MGSAIFKAQAKKQPEQNSDNEEAVKDSSLSSVPMGRKVEQLDSRIGSNDLNGIDWSTDVAKRRKNLKFDSLPNVRVYESKPRTTPIACTRLASSAEDDAVSALRTRVMNASFGRRKSDIASSGLTISDAVSCSNNNMRRKSMPSLSMPAKVMKTVRS